MNAGDKLWVRRDTCDIKSFKDSKVQKEFVEVFGEWELKIQMPHKL